MNRHVAPRRGSVYLLLALLPMLTYVGHWELDLPAIPFLASHDHGAHVHNAPESDPGYTHDHAQHCHGDSASCSDAPYAGSATVLFIAQRLLGLGSHNAEWSFLLRTESALTAASLAVETPPPRS